MSKLKTELQISKLFLFLTILLAPLYVVRFQIGPYPSTLLEILIGLTVVSAVIEKIRAKKIRFVIWGLPPAHYFFLLIAGISAIVSPDKHGALGILKAYFIEPFLVYLVIKDLVKSKKDWRLVFSALILSGLWVALLAVFQGLTGWLVFAPHEASLGRAHAVYNTANAVGLYLGPIILLLFGVLLSFQKKLKSQNSNPKTKTQISKLRKAATLAVVVMIFAVVLSKSAGAVVGLTTALLLPIACCLVPKIWRRRVVGAVGAALAIVGILFFFNISSFTPKNVDPYVRKSTDTLQFRLCLWEGARDLLLDKPVFGAGLSGFKELYAKKYFTCDAEPLEYPHNWVLNFWTETGFLGLLGFLVVLWVYFKKLTVHLLNPKTRWLALGFSAAMIYWLIHGLVDVPYFKNDLSLEFWVILGLAEASRK